MFSIKFAAQYSRQTPSVKGHGPRTTRGVKVAIVGGAGAVGQPLSLLLKMNSLITTLALQDAGNIKGIAKDLSHICTATEVECYQGEKDLPMALDQAAIVVLSSSGVPTTEMTPEQLLQTNSKVVKKVAKGIATSCPDALLAINMSPLNTIVPLMAKQLMEHDAYDPRRLFGVTTLDVMRAKCVLAECLGANPLKLSIPVVGGYAGDTTLPLLSQSCPRYNWSQQHRAELIQRVQNAAQELSEVKGKGGDFLGLSEAYGCASFVNALLRALHNEQKVIECAYVQSDVTEAQFFASPVLLGPLGIVENLGLPELDEAEEDDLELLIKLLIKDIDTGLNLTLC